MRGLALGFALLPAPPTLTSSRFFLLRQSPYGFLVLLIPPQCFSCLACLLLESSFRYHGIRSKAPYIESASQHGELRPLHQQVTIIYLLGYLVKICLNESHKNF